MMRSVSALLLWCLSCTSSLCALALPEWTEEERVQLEKGMLVPGASLLVETEEATPLLKPQNEPEEILPEPPAPEPPYDPKTIPSEHLVTYFQKYPERHLVDPQRLLTMQETQDREGFLNYHAEDSDIEIKLYLFDAQQQIPAPYTLRKLVKERYKDVPLTAVVFYFVGDPSRTMLTFGGRGSEKVTLQEQLRILDSARIKSLESSDASTQVEAFIVQLSIRLYWLEKSLEGVKLAVTTVPQAAEQSPSTTGKPAASGFYARYQPYMLYILVGMVGSLVSLAAIFMAWIVWQKNKKYRFPVIELPRRLGADYGAGVGAVLGFRDSYGSPSTQRDQVPDYLGRP